MNALTQTSMDEGEWSRRSSVSSSTYRDATLLWTALFGSDQSDVTPLNETGAQNSCAQPRPPGLNYSQISQQYTPEYSTYRETRRYSTASDVYGDGGEIACTAPADGSFGQVGYQFEPSLRRTLQTQNSCYGSMICNMPTCDFMISNRRNSAPALLDYQLQYCTPPNIPGNGIPCAQYCPPITNAPFTYSQSSTSIPGHMSNAPNEPSSLYRTNSENSTVSSSVGNVSNQIGNGSAQLSFLTLPASFDPMGPAAVNVAPGEIVPRSPDDVPIIASVPISRVESSGNISITTDVAGMRDADYYMASPVAMLTAGVANLDAAAEDLTPRTDPFGETSFFAEGEFGNEMGDREMQDVIDKLLLSGAFDAASGGFGGTQDHERAASSQSSAGGEFTTLGDVVVKAESRGEGERKVLGDSGAVGKAAASQAKNSQKATSRPRSHSDPPTMKQSVVGVRGSARYNPVKLHSPSGGNEHCPYQQKVEIATVGGAQLAAETGARIECCVCGRMETPLWRVFSDGNRYCNACGLYFKAHGKPRPLRGEPAALRDGMKERAKCTSCGTENTSLWRRNEAGELVCNACGLYEKVHHKSRPMVLLKKPKTKTSRRRPRAKSSPTDPPTLSSIPGVLH
eukprot:comp21566_c0_seq1/m.30113 comp21566_c0_seq1/g.30113  ORF comp21566_c0_seq1/g.30113 comp21566_c0_seq1/m.30113 type:complete len:625 (-) comp21566_c0_seq1:994-2868(-)